MHRTRLTFGMTPASYQICQAAVGAGAEAAFFSPRSVRPGCRVIRCGWWVGIIKAYGSRSAASAKPLQFCIGRATPGALNECALPLSRCGRADFCPDAPVGTVSDSAAFVSAIWLKRSSPSRSPGPCRERRSAPGSGSAAFYQNNVEAGHVAQRSVRRLLIAFPSRLKRRRPGAPWPLQGAPINPERGASQQCHVLRLLFFRGVPRSWT